MNKLKELLAAFPEYWQTDDESVPVLRFHYAGTSCWLKIENDHLEIVPSGSERVCIELDQVNPHEPTNIPVQLTIDQLVEKLTNPNSPDYVPNLTVELLEGSFRFFYDGTLKPHNLDNIWRTYPNIWTTYPLPPGLREAEDTAGPPIDPETGLPLGGPDGVYDTIGWYVNVPGSARPLMIPGIPTGIGDLAAVILTDTTQNLVENPELGASTNLLWSILRPFARVLRRADTYGQDLTRQMDLRLVEGMWLDYWGRVYGVERIYPEDDTAFRKRLVATTFKPRLSSTSIAGALYHGFGFTTTSVTDDGVSPYKFLVQFSAIPEQAHYFGRYTRELIDKYRAAGTYFTQTGKIVAPVEEVPLPDYYFRMRKQYASGITKGYISVNGAPWYTDVDFTTPDTSNPPGRFGGSTFGGTFFG